jgi:hypothetical protein
LHEFGGAGFEGGCGEEVTALVGEVPQRLKPQQLGFYRSAEALRHPKNRSAAGPLN